jgi:DNA polymerase-4
LDLFTYEKDAKEELLLEAIDHLRKKFGEDIIKKGLKTSHKEGHTDTSFNKDFLLEDDE